MSKFMTRFVKNESGATAIEYGLIAALIAVVLVGGMALVGDGLTSAFTEIQSQLNGTAS